MFSEVLLRLARRHLVSAIVDSVAFVVVLVAADLAQVITTMMLLKRFSPPHLLLSVRRRAVARKSADAASIPAAVSAISGAQGVKNVTGCL
jgi:hypothetical protein